jgi:REP element-mobilizing transposase RayT
MVHFEPDTYYHVYTHANGKENLFRCDENFRFFLKRYTDYIPPAAETLAYCLMYNHFHFFILTKATFPKLEKFQKKYPEPGIAYHKAMMQQFSNLMNSYTKSFNLRYNRKGVLFLSSLNAKPVADEWHYKNLIRYIHDNPVQAGFVKQMKDWEHSSYHTFTTQGKTRLKRVQVLNWFGSVDKYIDFHNKPQEEDLEKYLL